MIRPHPAQQHWSHPDAPPSDPIDSSVPVYDFSISAAPVSEEFSFFCHRNGMAIDPDVNWRWRVEHMFMLKRHACASELSLVRDLRNYAALCASMYGNDKRAQYLF